MNIKNKIENIYFNLLIKEDNIIIDEGENNVPLENNRLYRYIFIDSPDYGNRTMNDIKKIILINEIMDILKDIYEYNFE